ncbi:MAG: cobyrinate a,c-diamide synthase [Candidatus Binataceae bacterium]|jgi:cobyrinic acid a,c-diamide synthase
MRRLEIPRIVVAGVSSGVGKTTVTVGLISALRARGLNVAAFKCGPDYLDPTYHARAAGHASQNLDGWMMGRDAVVATFASASRGADIAVVEGMMGLFDGASPTSEEGSTAEIAKWLHAPVLLALDSSGIARSVAALAHGFRSFDPELRLAGLVCNYAGSRGHLELMRTAVGELPIVGGLPRRAELAFPERHLGLIAAQKDAVAQSLFEAWGRVVEEWFDIDLILEIARSAPPILAAEPADGNAAAHPRCRIGVAFDDAFHFYYEDNLRRLETLGAELIRFAPTRDRALPEADGLYFGGGYPECVADELSRNRAMLESIRAFAFDGGPIYAECGGLMYLSEGIRTLDSRSYPMVGVIPGEAVMSDRLQALGYVEVETRGASILGPSGLRFRGHQFRYSNLLPPPSDIDKVYLMRSRAGHEAAAEGYRVNNVLASYVHAHWASNPLVAQGLVDSCAAYASRRRRFA